MIEKPAGKPSVLMDLPSDYGTYLRYMEFPAGAGMIGRSLEGGQKQGVAYIAR